MSPVWVKVPLPFNLEGITFPWPFILLSPGTWNSVNTRAHELYHWRDALRWGVVPWYVAYIILAVVYIRAPANEHPLERGAYAAGDAASRA